MSRAAVVLALLTACTAAPGPSDPDAWFAAHGERPFAQSAVPVADAGSQWLVVGGRPAERGTAMLFADDGVRLAVQALGEDVAYAVAVAGPRAAVGMADGRVLLLSLPELQSTLRWRHAKAAVAVAFTPDGSWLASGGADGMVCIGPTGSDAAAIGLEHGAAVTCLAWSVDGERIAAGTRDGKVRLHERSGRLLRTWSRLGGEVTTVRWLHGRLQCWVRATAIADEVERPLPWP